MSSFKTSSIWVLLASLLLGFGCAPLSPTQDEAPPAEHWRKLIILHTNDVHGQVLPLPATWLKGVEPLPDSGGVERLAGYVQQVRAQAALDGADVLVVDAGDWFQGTPEGGVGDGLPFLQILGAVGYDAMAVGNHEFDHGVQVLEEHLLAAKVPALLANTSEHSGSFLRGTSPYLIVERAGIRIALVGLLSTETPSITHPSASTLFWADPAKVLLSLQADLKDRADWVLPLTHLGFPGDQELVAQVPGLPLVIGGHSHTVLPEGHKQGDTWIVQTGSKARAVGRIEVWIDPQSKTVERITPTIVNLYKETVGSSHNTQVEQLARALVERTEQHMKVVVGRLNGALTRGSGRFQTSSAGNWVTDVMREYSGADVALQNRGGLRSNLVAGPISRRDIFRMLPFNNTLTVLTMEGRDLTALMTRTVEGASPVTLEMSGMAVGLLEGADGAQLQSLQIAGEPVDPDRTYKVATNSYMAGGGDGFDEFTFVRERSDEGLIQRDLIENFFLKEPAGITPPGENRYSVESK